MFVSFRVGFFSSSVRRIGTKQVSEKERWSRRLADEELFRRFFGASGLSPVVRWSSANA